MKISIITAVWNRVESIGNAVSSVQKQTYRDLEHIVVDGVSSDGTLLVLKKMLGENSILISEPDNGIYDALNKGLLYATGDVIGLMHSDDSFADDNVLTDVVECFKDPLVDVVYGDLDYVAKNNADIVIRRWISGVYSIKKLRRGWMPPHPTMFVRRSVFQRWGGFDTRFKIAADYDFILRCFGQSMIRAVYIPRVLIKMRLGGESNGSFRKICRKTYEDYVALRQNQVGGVWALIWKNFSKIGQFFLVNKS